MRSRILLASIFALTLLALTHFALIWGNDSSSSSLSIPLHGGLERSAVQQSDCVLSASPASLTLFRGASASFAVRVPSCGGISEPVVLTVQGLPAGTTFSFNPQVIQPPANGKANSTLTLIVAPTAPVGSYPLNVTATYPDLVRWTRVVLNVLFDTDDVSISVSPNAQTILLGQSKTATVTATSIGAFNSILTLNAVGIPRNVTVTFAPQTLQPPMASTASSTMTINVGTNAPDGTYPLTIIANNGTLTRWTTFNLTILCSTYCLAVSPNQAIVYRGDAVNYTIHVFQPANTVGSLNVTGRILPFGLLTNSTLPTGLIAKFAPSLVQGNSTSTLTIQTSKGTPFSYYSLTIRLVSDSYKLNRDTQLIVKPARDEYTISASPTRLLVVQGYSGESVITARVLPLTDVVNEGVPMLNWYESTSMETQGNLPSVRLDPLILVAPLYDVAQSVLAVTVNQDVPLGNYTIGFVATWYPDTWYNETRQILIPLTVVTTTVIPPPTNPQTTNATLEYDLTNRLSENDTTCTYAWGPLLAISPTSVWWRFNFSSTSQIDTYYFSDFEGYEGTLSCTLGPRLHPPNVPRMSTGNHEEVTLECMGCSGEQMNYVLFINHDPTVTPHVTLEVAVKLLATTTTTVSPPPSTVPFIGVPEILLAILLGFFVVARMSRGKRSSSVRPHQ